MNINNGGQPNPNAYSDKSNTGAEFQSKEEYFDTQYSDPNFRDQESELNLESIVSAPMIAVSKANSIMLSGQTEFILNYCFNQFVNNNRTTYEPKMIDLVVNNVNNENSIVQIPLLTLLPINSLAIDKMKVNFNMEITSISSYKSQSGSLDRKAQLSGKLSGDKNNGSNSTSSNRNLEVSVEASKLPLPNGLLNIIEMYSKIN